MQDIVYTLNRRVCFWRLSLIHVCISRFSFSSSYNLISFFSIFRNCLSGRRTPIRRSSRRTCNRRDRDGRCAGYFVQGFLYWEMKLCWSVGSEIRQRGHMAAKIDVDGHERSSELGRIRFLMKPIWDVEWLPILQLRQWFHGRPTCRIPIFINIAGRANISAGNPTQLHRGNIWVTLLGSIVSSWTTRRATFLIKNDKELWGAFN